MTAPQALTQALGELLGDARLSATALPGTDLRLWLIDAQNMDRQFSPEETRRILEEPPYWCFCWASGLVLARWLAARPQWVRDKRVLDFGSGSGVAAIAAARAGAAEVVACDLDPLALAASRANAELNGVELSYSADFFAEDDRFDLILVADVLYDRANLPLLDQFLSRGRQALVAESYQGELLLAKVNCDVEQDIVMRFGIRSLPTVVLFKDGQPVDGFAGAQPESQIRALLEPHVKAPALPDEDPLEVAQALFAEGRIGDAEATLKALLAENNENAAALILYARCLAERGELEEAQAILDAVKSDEHKQALAGARAQLTFLRQAADLPDSAELKSRLAADAGDDEAAYQLAVQQLARQQYEAALDGLLKLFLRNRGYQDDLPRKTLVQVFDLLGNDHPLVTAYRRKLYQALY